MSKRKSNAPTSPAKRCTKCCINKPLKSFSKAKRGKYGLKAECRECASVAQQALKLRAKVAVPVKVCTSCKRQLPAELFAKSQASVDGRLPSCRECKSEYDKKNRSRFRARHLSRNAAWNAANAEKAKAYFHERYMANREERIRESRKYRIENRAAYLEYLKEWNKKNRALQRSNRARRRTRIACKPFSWTESDREFAIEWWQGRCVACRAAFGLFVDIHWDHWIPLCRTECPGTIPRNMLPLCDRCNLTKNKKLPEEWLTDYFGVDVAKKTIGRVRRYERECRSADCG